MIDHLPILTILGAILVGAGGWAGLVKLGIGQLLSLLWEKISGNPTGGVFMEKIKLDRLADLKSILDDHQRQDEKSFLNIGNQIEEIHEKINLVAGQVMEIKGKLDILIDLVMKKVN